MLLKEDSFKKNRKGGRKKNQRNLCKSVSLTEKKKSG